MTCCVENMMYTGAFHPDDLEGKQVTVERISENMKAQFLKGEPSDERFAASGKVTDVSENRRKMEIYGAREVDGK